MPLEILFQLWVSYSFSGSLGKNGGKEEDSKSKSRKASKGSNDATTEVPTAAAQAGGYKARKPPKDAPKNPTDLAPDGTGEPSNGGSKIVEPAAKPGGYKSRKQQTPKGSEVNQSVATPAASENVGAATSTADATIVEAPPADTSARPSAYRRKQNPSAAAVDKPAEGTAPAADNSTAPPATNAPNTADVTPVEPAPVDTSARPSAYRRKQNPSAAAVDKPAEGTAPAAASEDVGTAPATTSAPNTVETTQQNHPAAEAAAVDKPADGTPPAAAASEDVGTAPAATSAPSSAAATAAEAPAADTSSRPSAYRNRKQNQSAAAVDKPAEGTPPAAVASEDVGTAPAATSAPSTAEATAAEAPAVDTSARPSAYRNRKQNQSPSSPVSNPESGGDQSPAPERRSSYRQRRQSAAAAKPETRPSAYRSRKQNQYFG